MSRTLIIRDAILARQLKADQRARGISIRLSAMLNRYWPQILDLIPANPGDHWHPYRLNAALAHLRLISQHQLHRDLMTLGHWAGTGAARSLGAAYQRHFGESVLFEDDREPGEPPSLGGGLPPDPFERFKVGGLVQPPSAFELSRIVGPAPLKLTKLFDVDRIGGTVWQGIAQGQDRRKIAKTLQSLLNNDVVAARRVARTEGLRVATQTQLQVSEQLADEIAGYQVCAVLDSRTRPEHRERNGTIYYRHPVSGQKGFADMPQPPIDPGGKIAYNCRCFLAPVFMAEPVPAPLPMPDRMLAGAAVAA